MKTFVLFNVLIVFAVSLLAVHNFTINNSDNVQISIGDTLEVRFEYEEIGAVATVKIQINLSTFNFPEINPENSSFVDGGVMDETDEDGIFLYHFNNFAVFPVTSTVILTFSDNEISDEVTIGFQQIDSNFSISGNILKEGNYINLPVRGAFVYSFYNSNKDEISSLFENSNSEDFIDYMQQDKYFLSVLSDNSGEYRINEPDSIANVPCTVDVFSAIDTNKEKVSPATIDLLLNGNETGIDLLYQNPDGNFIGTVKTTEGDSLPNSSIIVTNSDTTNTIFTFSDSLGAFTIPLLNDTYSYKIIKSGYDNLVRNFSIDNADYQENIVLNATITHLDTPQNLNFRIENDSLFISWNSIENAYYYNVYSTDDVDQPQILWHLEISGITGSEWKRAIGESESKKFFKVTANK